MYGYIYETTCVPTGKKYIGMHKWSKDTIDPNYLGSGLHLKELLINMVKKILLVELLNGVIHERN